HHREGGRPPRLDLDDVAGLELPHMELAGGGAELRAVGLAVDHDAAGAADAFPAIVFESDGLFILGDEALVEEVEHLEERHVLADAGDVVVDHDALRARAGLAPDPQFEVEGAQFAPPSGRPAAVSNPMRLGSN